MRPFLLLAILVGAVFLTDCNRKVPPRPGAVWWDRSVSEASAYPLAVDPQRVGAYALETSSGAGYFYDYVLEYRVWLHPERGAEPIHGGSDYCVAFAQCERAEAFAKTAKGAEEPLALVRQLKWIDEPEPEPGHYIPEDSERVTEWRVPWLTGSKRAAGSIDEFMKHPRPIRE